MAGEILRKCPTCGEQYFHKTRLKCAPCAKAYNAAWYSANKERVAVRAKRNHALNREKYKATSDRYRAANVETLKAKRAVYYAANREASIEKSKAWRRRNPEKVRARNAADWQKNREENNARRRAWGAQNPEKERAWREAWNARNADRVRILKANYKGRKRGGKLSLDIIERLLKLQRGRCACCGKPLSDDFHLDHRVPLVSGGKHEDGNMQLLRAVCNLQKNDKDPIDFMQSRGYLL